MLAEHPLLTTKRFIPSWRNIDPNRLSEEIKSVYNETHHEPDNLSFIIKNGELIDPATAKVFDFQRTTPIEIAEGKVWDNLKLWANQGSKGQQSIWISPLLESKKINLGSDFSTAGTGYPTNKLCLYEIDETNDVPPIKILKSTTILFDAPKNYCLEIAEKINPLFKNIEDPEFLRSQLIKLQKDFDLLEILEIIGQTQSKQVLTPSQETINYFVNEIKSGKNSQSIVEEMKLKGIIGNYSISCPTAGSNILLNGTKILNFTENFKNYDKILECIHCPQCKQTVKAGIKDGHIHCLSCGASAPWTESAAA